MGGAGGIEEVDGGEDDGVGVGRPGVTVESLWNELTLPGCNDSDEDSRRCSDGTELGMNMLGLGVVCSVLLPLGDRVADEDDWDVGAVTRIVEMYTRSSAV